MEEPLKNPGNVGPVGPREYPRPATIRSILAVDEETERRIRNVARKLVEDPVHRKKWLQEELLTQAAILAFRARNSESIDEITKAATAFQRLVSDMAKKAHGKSHKAGEGTGPANNDPLSLKAPRGPGPE